MSAAAARGLDPRLHLAAAIGWAVFTLVRLVALVAATVAGNDAEQRERADTERLLVQFASQIRRALAMSLETIWRAIFVVVLAAGLLAAAAAVMVTRMLTRRLVTLANEAQAVRSGARRSLAVPAGADEVSRIRATLAEVVDPLQQEKRALLSLNTELDARVAERTVRIEPPADEARNAAVTRERLRFARDLHDTLTHSLMALPTQIRLVRKLRHRFEFAELDAELGRAEKVAASGLMEARAASTQMRHTSVRDTGLRAALQELPARFGERTGTTTALEADVSVAGLADERAETVFRIVEHHAQAASVRVASASTALLADTRIAVGSGSGSTAWARVEIADDGIGCDPTPPRPGHYRLIRIRELAAPIKARLSVHSGIGDGTRVILEFDA